MTTMQVDLVSAERRLWSGQAEMVVARTVAGEIGILPGHAPVLAELTSSILRILLPGEPEVVAAIHGGFLSVSADGVSILADIAELSPDIDKDRAQEAADRAQQTLNGDPEDADAKAALGRAHARLKAVSEPARH